MARQRVICILAAAIALVPASISFSAAERVGYQFTGSIEPTFGSTATLFGVELQLPASISGTFSYDTLGQAGTPDSAGAVPYKQSIDGGFTLKTDDERLRLSADHFKVLVTNDYHRTMPVETVDIVDVTFDNTDPLTPGPIHVNGQPWTGAARNYIVLELSYPPETFADATLPPALPQTYSPGLYSGLGSSRNSFQFFRITSLTPVPLTAGDYNVDGKLDDSDLAEWRKCFGETAQVCRYADGNGDGVVDGGDYLVWRRAAGSSGAGNALGNAAVPEPGSLVWGWIPFVALLSRRARLHRRCR